MSRSFIRMATAGVIAIVATYGSSCLVTTGNRPEGGAARSRTLDSAAIRANVDPSHLEYPYTEAMVRELQRKTGVALITNVDKIHKEEVIMDHTVDRADLLPLGHLEWAMKVVRTALKEYPPSMLSKYLREIVVCKNLSRMRPGGMVEIGGTYNLERRRLLVNLEPEQYPWGQWIASVRQATEMFHHELNHLLTRLVRFPEGQWESNNPPGFAYTELYGANYLEDYDERELEMGFVGQYSRISVSEDIAVMAGKFFSNRDEFIRRAREYPIVMKKFDVLKDYYRKLDPGFGKSYWEGQVEGNPDLFLGYLDYYVAESGDNSQFFLSELIVDSMEWYAERYDADFAVRIKPYLSLEDRIEGFLIPGGVDEYDVLSAFTGGVSEFYNRGTEWRSECPPNTLHVVSLAGEDVKEFVSLFTNVRGFTPVVFSRSFDGAIRYIDGRKTGELSTIEIRGQGLDPQRQYRVAVSAFLVSGGVDTEIHTPSDYFLQEYAKGFLGVFSKASEDFDSGVLICDVLGEYIRAEGTVHYEPHNRLHWF